MRIRPSCRVPALTGLATVLLAGCGGIADGIAEPIVDGFGCALRNCTESSTLNVDEISPRFTATQVGSSSSIAIEGSLGKSANVFTTVMPASSESLSAGADAGAEVRMSNPDGKRLDYTASLSAASAQPVVRVVFTRAGVRHVSQVTLPAAFALLQPTGSAVLTRMGSALPVRLNVAAIGDAAALASGTCSRTDGSSFTVTDRSLGAITETSVAGGYRLEPLVVDTALNEASRAANNGNVSTPAVTACQLTVAWTRSAQGTVAATMNSHGSLTGRRQVTHPLAYDARA